MSNKIEGKHPSGRADLEGGYLRRIETPESSQLSASIYPKVEHLNIDSSSEAPSPSAPLYPGEDHGKEGSTQFEVNRLSRSIAH